MKKAGISLKIEQSAENGVNSYKNWVEIWFSFFKIFNKY